MITAAARNKKRAMTLVIEFCSTASKIVGRFVSLSSKLNDLIKGLIKKSK